MVIVSSGLNMDGSASRRAPVFAGSGMEPGLVKPGHGGGCTPLQGVNKAVPKAVPPPKDPPTVLASGWGSIEDVGDGSCGMPCSMGLLHTLPRLSSEPCFARPARLTWGVQGDGQEGGAPKVCCGGPAFTAN